MRMKLIIAYFFILFISGILMYLAHPPNLIFSFAFFCLIPMLFFISKIKNNTILFWGCLFSGLIYFLFSFKWVLEISIHHLENSGSYFYLFKFLFFIFLCFISAFFYGIWGITVKYFYAKKSFFRYFILPSVSLILLEYFRSFFISLIFYGDGGLIGSHWTFGALGYDLVNYIFISKLASFGGIYLLSFLIVFFNLLIFSFLKQDFSKRYYVKIVGFLFLILLFLNLFSTSFSEAINVGVIQTGFNNEISDSEINELLSVELSNSNLVVLPENIGSKSLVSGGEIQYISIIPNENQLVVFSKNIILDQKGDLKSLNVVYYLDGQNYIFNSYAKTFLMPFGEYNPYLLGIFIPSKLKKEHIIPGKTVVTTDFKNHTYGALVCGSYMSPILFSSLVREGKSEVLINVASNSAFLQNEEYREINLAYSRIRALENNRYFIQSSHAGYSFILDNHGKILFRTNSFDFEILSNKIYLIDTLSFYSRFGDWVILVGIVLFLFFIFRNLFK